MKENPSNTDATESTCDSSSPEETPTTTSTEDVVEAASTEAQVDTTTETPTEDPLATALTEVEQWKDRALRAQAELDNFRRRSARETQETVKFANARLLEDLLPVLDNFHLGMSAAKQEENSMIYQGMNMVSRQLDDFLERSGVEVVSTSDKFDPTIHEAMEQQSSLEVEEGHIIRVVRRGFSLNQRLLRPASVIVSSGPQTEDSKEA